MTAVTRLFHCLCIAGGTLVTCEASDQLLFDLGSPAASREWQTVNDGVMGGRSSGRFRINEDKHLEFFGNLSLVNNGGFASVRSRPRELSLRSGDTIVLNVRGDGRQYSLNLYPRQRRTAFSYRAKFQTRKDEWTIVEVPVSNFVATSFGRVVRGVTLNPADITGLGILLGDKKAGVFKLEVESISVSRN